MPNPSAIIPIMPPGSAVIVRSKSPDRQELVAHKIAGICRHHQVKMLISYEKPPRLLVGDGIHVPEKARANWSRNDFWRLRPGLVTTSAHSLTAAKRASIWSADAVLLSPIAVTQSHPGASSLGFWRGASIQGQIDIPAIALGGIDMKSVRRVFDLGFQGCAGIGLFAS